MKYKVWFEEWLTHYQYDNSTNLYIYHYNKQDNNCYRLKPTQADLYFLYFIFLH